MARRPASMPDATRRWVTRVPPDPRPPFDTNDYSLDPALVGRRAEVCADQREITAVALDTGELDSTTLASLPSTARSRRSKLRAGREPAHETVEARPLVRYDALIA